MGCKKVMESRCRELLEEMYPGHRFDAIRPEWLKSTITGKNLELDGYNHALRLAFEYNGEQHYRFPNHWHKSVAQFKKTVAHDMFKADACRRIGIFLLTIPFTVPKAHLGTYMRAKLASAIAVGTVVSKPRSMVSPVRTVGLRRRAK